MITFHAGKKSVWRAINGETGKRRQIVAAIAYMSKAAALPFKRGDILVANFSMLAVKTGSSNPKAAIALVRKGVDVRCHTNLHAKVILVGDRLFVGSMNASTKSADSLVEAMVETTDAKSKSKAGRWLRKLREPLKRMTIAELEALAQHYNPPRGGSGKSQKAPETGTDKRPAKTWLFQCIPSGEESEEADAIAEEGPGDERFAGYRHEWYNTWRSRWGNIKPGDFIVSTYTEDGSTEVWPTAEVWENRIIKGKRFLFVAHGKADEKRIMPWDRFKPLAIRHGMPRKHLKVGKSRMIPSETADFIGENWPQPRKKPGKRA